MGLARSSINRLNSVAEYKILAQAGGVSATADIDVRVPQAPGGAAAAGLTELDVTDFIHLSGATKTHPDNHFGTQKTIQSAKALAHYISTLLFLRAGGTQPIATVGINDMSLSKGGLFDICGRWDRSGNCQIQRLVNGQLTSVNIGCGKDSNGHPIPPPCPKGGGHNSHRLGTSVDVDSDAWLDPDGRNWTPIRRDFFFNSVCSIAGGNHVKEATYHCEFPE